MMKHYLNTMAGWCRIGTVALLLIVALPVQAQLSTGTVRGTVAGAAAGVQVEAINPDTGASRAVQTRDDGSYVIVGLRPAAYTIRALVQGQTYEKTVRLQVAQTLVVDLGPSAGVKLETVTVTGTAPVIEMKTSEVGTNVTTDQIENLPQSSRNFLNFAQLAPGVRVSRDEFRQQFSGGATNAQGDSLAAGQTNVFIDGVSLKSNIQQGGLVGQDASRGNPFSQLAVQEFKVLTQNFKAEYEQAGSSVITAVTKSGTNELHGEGFGLFAPKSFTEKDFFVKRDDRPKPSFHRNQYGGALGGPLIKDKLFFFVTYEGNDQIRSNNVVPGVPTPRQLADLGFDPQQFAGTKSSAFHEDLYFAKLNWDISDRQALEVSYSNRNETDLRDFGGLNSIDRANNINNDVTTVRARHQYFGDVFTNEFTFDYRDSTFNPQPENSTDVARDFRNIINLGGQPFQQDVGDTVYTFRDNITFADIAWHGNHVVKAGVRVAQAEADVRFGAFINPQFTFQDEPTQGLDFSFPAEARIGIGDPDISVDNTQYGFFLQDDWEVTDKLTLNLGVRWDAESNANNKNFVTPQPIADTLRALQVAIDADTAAGLAAGIPRAPDAFDFRAEDFISTGSNRNPYKKAWQPRVGFSYDFSDDERTVVFGGYARSFDRTLFRVAAEEAVLSNFQQRLFRFSKDGAPRFGEPTIPISELSGITREALLALIGTGLDPGREIRVVNNNLKPPHSDQFSLGVRQRFTLFDNDFNASVTASRIESHDDIAFFPANRTQFDRTNDGPLDFIQTPQDFGKFGNVVAGINAQETRFNALYVTLDKPYTAASGWGMGIAYTLAYAKQRGSTFNFDFINPKAAPFHPNAADERHRIVLNAIVDLPWDLKLSTLATFASGQPFTVIDLSNGFGRNVVVDNSGNQPGGLSGFSQIDLRLQKDFKLSLFDGNQAWSVYIEAINLFDTTNIGGRDGFIPREGIANNPNFGAPQGLAGPPRTVQFGTKFSF